MADAVYTVYPRFRRWTREGLWDRILAVLERDLDAVGQIDWELWCIDGSHVRAHKHAAGAGGKAGAGRAGRPRPGAQPRRVRGHAPPRHWRARAAARRRPQRDAGARVALRPTSRPCSTRCASPGAPAAHRHGRPPAFDRAAYRRRAVIECCVGWLKEARRIATRYEKLAGHFLGVRKLGMLQKHLQLALSDTP